VATGISTVLQLLDLRHHADAAKHDIDLCGRCLP